MFIENGLKSEFKIVITCTDFILKVLCKVLIIKLSVIPIFNHCRCLFRNTCFKDCNYHFVLNVYLKSELY